MDKKLKKEFENALTGAGLDLSIMDAFKDKDEKTIKNFINGLSPSQEPTMDEVVASGAFTKYLEDGGFDKLLSLNKKAQSAFDRKTSKALETFRQNLLGGNKEVNDDDDDDVLPKTENKDVLDFMKKLSKQVEELSNERSTQTKRQKAEELLKKSTLPEAVRSKWIDRLNLTEELPEQITKLEKEYVDIFGDNDGSRFDMSRGNTENGKLKESDKKELAEMAKKL